MVAFSALELIFLLFLCILVVMFSFMGDLNLGFLLSIIQDLVFLFCFVHKASDV